MIDFDAIAKNVPFTVECYMTAETGQAQQLYNEAFKIHGYWHEKDGMNFSFEGSFYETLPKLLEANPMLAGAVLFEYGIDQHK